MNQGYNITFQSMYRMNIFGYTRHPQAVEEPIELPPFKRGF